MSCANSSTNTKRKPMRTGFLFSCHPCTRPIIVLLRVWVTGTLYCGKTCQASMAGRGVGRLTL